MKLAIQSDEDIIKSKLRAIANKIQDSFNKNGVLTDNEKLVLDESIKIAQATRFVPGCTVVAQPNGVGLVLAYDNPSKKVEADFQHDVTIINPDLRPQIKNQQEGLVKPVQVKGLTPALEYGLAFSDQPGNSKGKTESAYSPQLMVEKILRDMSGKNKMYSTAQDAYDGYTAENSLWAYASPKQKVKLGELMQYFGFNINFDKWKKEAEKDKAEYLELHKDYAAGKPNPKDKVLQVENRDNSVTASLNTENQSTPLDKKKVEAKDTNNYCNKCGKTTAFSVSDSGDKTCKKCGTNTLKKAIKPPTVASFCSFAGIQVSDAGNGQWQVIENDGAKRMFNSKSELQDYLKAMHQDISNYLKTMFSPGGGADYNPALKEQMDDQFNKQFPKNAKITLAQLGNPDNTRDQSFNMDSNEPNITDRSNMTTSVYKCNSCNYSQAMTKKASDYKCSSCGAGMSEVVGNMSNPSADRENKNYSNSAAGVPTSMPNDLPNNQSKNIVTDTNAGSASTHGAGIRNSILDRFFPKEVNAKV